MASEASPLAASSRFLPLSTKSRMASLLMSPPNSAMHQAQGVQSQRGKGTSCIDHGANHCCLLLLCQLQLLQLIPAPYSLVAFGAKTISES
jgi:hypothetical protein